MLGGPLTDAADARERARRVLPRLVFDYIDGAAGSFLNRKEMNGSFIIFSPSLLM